MDVPFNQGFPVGGSALPLNGIGSGPSFFQRIGRRIRMTTVRISGQLVFSGTNPGAIPNEYLRIMVVYSKQTNGAVPTLNDILQDVDHVGGLTNNAYSGFNLDNRYRFEVIMDKRISFGQWTNTGGVITNMYPNDGVDDFNVDEFRTLDHVVQFEGDTAFLTSIATGGLYLVTTSLNNQFNFAGVARVRYADQ